MTQTESNVLEKLCTEYDQKFGEGKAHEISGALMFSLSIADQIKVFKKARGREIVFEEAPGVIDGTTIKYK